MCSGNALVEVKALLGGLCSGLEITYIYWAKMLGMGDRLVVGKKAQVSYVEDRMWVDFIKAVNLNV
jgi:hypothetical protein